MSTRRILSLATVTLAVLALAGWGLWMSLGFRPAFHSHIDAVPREQRQAEARKFWAQSTQLRNDIANEPRWEAVFSEDEVNAWLSEDLVAYFADQIPAGIADPRVSFESGRVTMAFRYAKGALRTYISVQADVRVVDDNVLALRIDSIRAGVVPVSADAVLEHLTEHARAHGLDVKWEREAGKPVAFVRYSPDRGRRDVVLERLVIGPKQIRLAGRSDRSRGIVRKPSLPRRRVLQSTFPVRRSIQSPSSAIGPVSFLIK